MVRPKVKSAAGLELAADPASGSGGLRRFERNFIGRGDELQLHADALAVRPQLEHGASAIPKAGGHVRHGHNSPTAYPDYSMILPHLAINVRVSGFLIFPDHRFEGRDVADRDRRRIGARL